MKLRKIYTNHFPAKGFTAITVLLWCFIRRDKAEKYTAKVEQHENIHLQQEIELLFVVFYILYWLEWLVKLVIYRDRTKAYYNISFEQEAYRKEAEDGYLESRRHYAWVRYIFTKYR